VANALKCKTTKHKIAFFKIYNYYNIILIGIHFGIYSTTTATATATTTAIKPGNHAQRSLILSALQIRQQTIRFNGWYTRGNYLDL